MSKSKEIISNTFVQVFGRATLALMSVVTLKLLTHYLSVEGYGNYGSIYEYLALFSIFADYGLFTIGVREMSEKDDKEHIQKVYSNLLTLRLILVLISMGLAILIAYLIPQYRNTPIPMGVVLASIFVMLTLMQGGVSTILQYNLKMFWVTIANILGKILTLGVIATTIYFIYPQNPDKGFNILIIAGAIGAFLTFLITFFSALKYAKVRLGFDFQYWKHLMKRAAPYGIAIALSTIYFKFNITMLRVMKGETDAGLYLVPMRILEVLNVVPLYFMNSILPTMTKMIKKGQNEFDRVMQYCFDFLSMFGIPMLIGGYLLAYPLISIVSSPKFLTNLKTGFLGSDIAFQYLLIAMIFAYFTGWLTFTLVALEKQIKLLWINLASVIFNIVLNLIVIPAYGFRGATLASILTEALVMILAFVMILKIKPFKISFRNFWKIVFAGILMGAIVYFGENIFAKFGNIGIMALIVFAGGVYGVMLYLLKVLRKETFRLPASENTGIEIRTENV